MIIIKSPREIELIRKSCRIVVKTFELVGRLLKPGVKTIEIDEAVTDYIQSQGARPAFKGYRGYPASVCVSIDDQVVHGIPDRRKLESGQIVGIDIGVQLDEYFGDAARTFAIGEISPKRQKLLKITEEALYKGIDKAVEGNRLSDVSHAIQKHVENANFSVVRDLVGHGIGRKLHEDPQVPNYGKPNHGPRLKEGMVLAIEPMVNAGGYQVRTSDDNWTIYTQDGSPSAHFEHTIVITRDKPEILTKGR
ncbi:type I methionyl aminopeptidase [candidate division KSB1 bacterium]|nr:type I methionyl aminopeptidase [candidate division KSB1 bacterium]